MLRIKLMYSFLDSDLVIQQRAGKRLYRILEEEQSGRDRADYGTYLIAGLASRLEPEFGSGFTKRQLERARQFYRTYPNASAVRSQLDKVYKTVDFALIV